MPKGSKKFAPKDLLKLGTAAKTLGRTKVSLRRWMKAGRLDVVKIDGQLFVPTTEIGRLEAARNVKEQAI